MGVTLRFVVAVWTVLCMVKPGPENNHLAYITITRVYTLVSLAYMYPSYLNWVLVLFRGNIYTSKGKVPLPNLELLCRGVLIHV